MFPKPGAVEFTYRFGMTEHANGKKSRRNKVLLNFIKDKNLLKESASGRMTLHC